jgi:hypothetical protein
MATYYSSIAAEQQPFLNFPGGGMTAQGSAGFNDPALEIGSVKEVIAYYTMTGSEVANDVVNLYLAQPGTMIDPAYSSVCSTGIATTATITVGDDDTTGNYIYGNTAVAASATRYSTALNVAAATTTQIGFTGGVSLNIPYQIGALAIEPQGSSPGTGVSGAWVYATFATLATPVAGKVLVFRLKVVKP